MLLLLLLLLLERFTMATKWRVAVKQTNTFNPSLFARDALYSQTYTCKCSQKSITGIWSRSSSLFCKSSVSYKGKHTLEGSTLLAQLTKHIIPYSKQNRLFPKTEKYKFVLRRAYSSDISDLETDFADIKLMMKHKLEEKKSPSSEMEKRLGLLDILFKHRLQHVDNSVIREEASKFDPAVVYELASDIFSLQEKVGEEAAILSGPLFRHAALSGDLNAKYSYGQLLRLGQAGIDPDPKEAATIFSELAKKGHPFAQFALGGMYYAGSGVKQDLQTAYTLFQIAAENGVVQGYNMIGKMYFHGESVEADFKKAFEYFKKGADKEEVGALMSIAHCYSHGKGVDVDFKKAFEYHNVAASKGHVPALYNIGSHYFSGRGVELDMKQAANFFKRAADLGFSMAQVNLGNMYYNGLGVEKDWNTARTYYKHAAPSNHNARLLLEELESEMKKNGMEIKD